MSAEGAAPTRPALGFRPDIQGIRALAVLLVVVNHLAPGRLNGGFIGVDVFFVVSGYLITSLLLGESARTGRISLGRFYARRARRIIPAATVVTIVTVVVSLLTMSLVRVQTILTDAVWATFFAANVRMAQVGTDYFAIGQPPSPLRHYWSLAVEEQFYLVWPALVLGCLVLLRRRGDRSGAGLHRWAGTLIAVVIVVSFGWSVWATYVSPVSAYYSSLARAWELGIGAACALLPRPLGLTAKARQGLALAGLGGIALAALWFSGATPFPGAWAALPVLATAALIVAGEGSARTVPGRLLSLRPMVLVGDWSYSLYLWHWPMIVFVRSHLGAERFNTVAVRLGMLLLMLLVSWASFRWIETPFRRGTWRRPSRALLIYPVSIAAVLVTVVAGTQVVRYQLGEFSNDPPISTADYATRKLGSDPYVALVRASVLAAKQSRPVPSHLTPGLLHLRSQTASLGDCDYRTGTTRLCPIGDPEAERTIVVLGDSHARALSPAIDEIGRSHGYRVFVLVYSGCSANSLVQFDRSTGRTWDSCEKFKSWADDTIASMHPDLVVVSTSAGRVVDPSTGDVLSSGRTFDRYVSVLEQGWRTLLDRLQDSADRVALVGDTPKLPRETGVCLTLGDPDLGDCAFPPGRHAHREGEASLRAAEAAGVEAVDASKWFCADGLCPSVVGRYITMRDSEHMTPDYARWLAEPLALELGVAGPTATG
jgi:peptidoglycan/LPS O-acetylase OafA/YrhL